MSADSTNFSCCVFSVLYYVRSYKHVEALWFANTANSLLWWTYVKAFWRALNSVFGEKIKFKTTLKGENPPLLFSCRLSSKSCFHRCA